MIQFQNYSREDIKLKRPNENFQRRQFLSTSAYAVAATIAVSVPKGVSADPEENRTEPERNATAATVEIGSIGVWFKSTSPVMGIAGLGGGEGDRIWADYASFLKTGKPRYGIYTKVAIDFTTVAGMMVTSP